MSIAREEKRGNIGRSMENDPEYIAAALRGDKLFEEPLLSESILFLVFPLRA